MAFYGLVLVPRKLLAFKNAQLHAWWCSSIVSWVPSTLMVQAAAPSQLQLIGNGDVLSFTGMQGCT